MRRPEVQGRVGVEVAEASPAEGATAQGTTVLSSHGSASTRSGASKSARAGESLRTALLRERMLRVAAARTHLGRGYPRHLPATQSPVQPRADCGRDQGSHGLVSVSRRATLDGTTC